MRISAEYECGGRFDQDNGVITSPLYPANYINSEACIYDIVYVGDAVKFTPKYNLQGSKKEKNCTDL